MLFAGGMPILYLVTAANFALSYWVEKAELLKLSRVPPQYTANLARFAGSMLPFAATWHFALSLWSFTFFRTDSDDRLADGPASRQLVLLGNLINTVLFGSEESEQRGIGARALQKNGAPHAIAFIATAVILILKETTNIWLSALKYLASLVGLASSPDLADQAQGLPTFATAVRSRLIIGPSTYAIEANSKYAVAFRKATADRPNPDVSQRNPKDKKKHTNKKDLKAASRPPEGLCLLHTTESPTSSALSSPV
eukprot:jgi/Botrbrau1/13683/Bobra.0378s0014.2